MRFNCEANINASAVVDQPGITLDGSQLVYCSAQAVVTGSNPTGTLNLQMSNDPPKGLSVDSSGKPIPVNWSNIPSATVTITGNGPFLIPNTVLSYRWVRAFFVHGNGASGNIVVNMETTGP